MALVDLSNMFLPSGKVDRVAAASKQVVVADVIKNPSEEKIPGYWLINYRIHFLWSGQ
jgi:hypothetical protein